MSQPIRSLLVGSGFIASVMLVCNTIPVRAQLIPPTVDPSRVRQELLPPVLPRQPEPPPLPQPQDLVPPPGAEAEKFRLESLQIEGATVYGPERLRSLYASLLGTEVSLADLYRIANQITQLYRRDGYVLSRALVPEQTVQGGVARIQVVEGYIERVEFQGAPQRQLDRLDGFGEKLVAARPLNIEQLERYLLLANDLAGFEVQAVLSPGTEVGSAIATFQVKYDPTDPYGELNNRNSDEVGPLQLQAGIFLNSLFGQGEQFTFSGATTPEDTSELAYGFGRLVWPIGSEGLRLDISGSYTAVRPGEDLRQFDINGSTTSFEVFAHYPVVRSRTTNVYFSGGFDYNDSKNTTLFTGTEETLSSDRLRVLRAGVQLDHTDPWGYFLASAQVSQGIGGLGATTEGTLNEPLSRAQGSAEFTKLNLYFARLQELPAQFNVFLSTTAQITGNALLVPEQFGLGGPTFLSAFVPSEVIGDYGYAVRAELQRPISYQAWGLTMTTQPYLFSDYGQVFRKFATAAEKSSDALGDVGVGIRHNFGEKVFVGVELAIPFQQTNEPFTIEPNLFFTITGTF